MLNSLERDGMGPQATMWVAKLDKILNEEKKGGVGGRL